MRPLRLIASVSVTDAATQKNIYGSGITALIISNGDVKYMKRVKSLDESGILIKDVSETIENAAIEQKDGSLSMLTGKLGLVY